MTPTRLTPLAALLCLVLLAGCGSSSSSSSSTTTTSSSSAPASGQSTSTPSIPTGSSAQVAAAVAECKSLIAAQTKLPEGAKHKLEGACSKAAKGDTAAVKQAAREVCEEVIDTSSIPNGTAKEAAKSACKK
jgi:hypothetical protein